MKQIPTKERQQNQIDSHRLLPGQLTGHSQLDPPGASVPSPNSSLSPVTLLFTLYPPAPRGAETFHRWPIPLRRLRVDHATPADATLSLLLTLLQDGGTGSHVQVDVLNDRSGGLQ